MKNVSADIPREVVDVLEDLVVIASIPSASKLNVSSGTYVASDSYIGSLSRTYYKENKFKTVDHIDIVISRAIDAARKYPECRDLIAEHVSGISDALVNLMNTYSAHGKIVGKLKTLKLKISVSSFTLACQESS